MGLMSALARLSTWLRWQCPDEVFGPGLMGGIEIVFPPMRSSWMFATAAYGSTKWLYIGLEERTAHRTLKGVCRTRLPSKGGSDINFRGIAATPN